jgi:hypothetical protein
MKQKPQGHADTTTPHQCDGDVQYERGYREGFTRAMEEARGVLASLGVAVTSGTTKKRIQAMDRQKLVKAMNDGIAQAIDDIANGFWGPAR